MALFEYNADKTQGVSLYLIDSGLAVERKRSEKLLYRKESAH
jgi:hypothetical protein